MGAYLDFVALSQSTDSEDRGRAAHMAAQAYIDHTGPADEHAALYAALIGFLDDPSVKVRAALAYGLLHALSAPRPILLALLQDSPVISRAVAQYAPALVEADLLMAVRNADEAMLLAIAARERIGARLASAVVERGGRPVLMKLLPREDVPFGPELFRKLARDHVGDAELRGLLLARNDLPAAIRLQLVEEIAALLRGHPIVSGAVVASRLDRLLRDATDTALTGIGEEEAAAGRAPYAADLVSAERISTRVMLHAVVHGHVLFFADCLAELSETPREKVLTLLESGSRVALNALLSRCGLVPVVRSLIARLIFHARAADLADDTAARHYVVTALTEELIVEHDGMIPSELEPAFAYLSEQNVLLARRAARGVLMGFAEISDSSEPGQDLEATDVADEDLIPLSAA